MKNIIFGISGSSGSGKSHIVNYIKNHFEKDIITVIHHDNYYKRREFQKKDSKGNYNFDLPSSFLDNELYDDLQKLKNNSQISRVEYNYNNSRDASKNIIVKPKPIILLEGLFIFHYYDLVKLIDRKIFIDVDQKVMINRRIKRDAEERGYDKKNVLYKYHNHIIPSFKKYILPYKKDADFIVNNTVNDNKAANSTFNYIKSEFSLLNNNI